MKENSTKLAETANNGCDLSRSNSSNTFRFLLLQCTHVVLYLLHTWLGKACHAKFAGVDRLKCFLFFPKTWAGK